MEVTIDARVNLITDGARTGMRLSVAEGPMIGQIVPA